MCDNKIINSKCICNKQFITNNLEIISICPCEHLIHVKCFNGKLCPLCNTKITKIVKINDYKKNIKYTQQCIDILSVTFPKEKKTFDIYNILQTIPSITNIGYNLYNMKTKTDCKNIIKQLFEMLNIKIKVSGLNKIKQLNETVYIANHSCHLDALVLHYFLNCGFLAGIQTKPSIDTLGFGKIVPFLYTCRGTKQNTVKAMIEFVKHNGSICVFPEGTYYRQGTIGRFRSGAFKTGFNVCPIVLKYSDATYTQGNLNNIYEIDCILNEFKNLTIEMIILDPVYPPFNNENIETIRHDMAIKGNLNMSRILANDVNDKNN